MALIVLQADPLVEWDDTLTKTSEQSEECQEWVSNNLFNQEPTEATETVSRPDSGRGDLTRPTKRVYSDGTFEITRDFTYPSVESYKGMTEVATLIAL